MKHKRYSHGFMLLEAMIASVVLAVAAIGIASLLLAAHEQQQTIQETNTATLLARQLMEEIAAKPLGTYVTTATPGSRANYTTACQYNWYSDSTETGITTLSGESVSFATSGNYIRRVTISSTTATVTQTNPNDICQVTVTVTTPSGKSVSLSKWLTNVTWGF